MELQNAHLHWMRFFFTRPNIIIREVNQDEVHQAGCASLKKGGTEFPGKSEISMVPHSDH